MGLRQVRSKEEMKNTAAHPIGVEWVVPKASKVAMRESKAHAAIAKAEGDEMKDDEIAILGKNADAYANNQTSDSFDWKLIRDARFAQLAAAAEREACANFLQELEAMLEAVGAGGVSAQRIRQESDHIEQPIEMVAAPVVLPEPVAAQTRLVGGSTNWTTVSLFHAKSLTGGAYELRYLHTEQQVRELLAKTTCTKSQTQEPFGYFKAEPFGWRDCADTDEGAIALYEAPQPQADALDAECFRFWVSEAARSPAAMAKLIMHCTTEDEYRAAITQCIDARKAAIAAAKEI